MRTSYPGHPTDIAPSICREPPFVVYAALTLCSLAQETANRLLVLDCAPLLGEYFIWATGSRSSLPATVSIRSTGGCAMKQRLRGKLTYANVVSSPCLFLLLGGGAAFAASQLTKNSVGPKQLKKNAMVTAKIKNRAVTGAKLAPGAVTAASVAAGSLTGAQVNASMLGTVPTAQSANSAKTAAALTPSEPWRVVGAPGEPAFAGSWFSIDTSYPEVAFYKDPTGIVHLKGPAAGGSGSGGEVIFSLPPGFRPDPGKFLASRCSAAATAGWKSPALTGRCRSTRRRSSISKASPSSRILRSARGASGVLT